MERHADREFSELKGALIRMAGLATDAIGRALQALVNRDAALADEILRGDSALNDMELDIDERCMRMFALYHPEASDLRFVAMAMKINGDLERIGDQAVNIAQRSLELLKEPPLKPLVDIPYLANLARSMLERSVEAFVRRDVALARRICQDDDQVDALDEQIFRELLTYMLVDAKAITRAVNLVLISRHLERVADHATNIAEDVIYLIEGRQAKHGLGLEPQGLQGKA